MKYIPPLDDHDAERQRQLDSYHDSYKEAEDNPAAVLSIQAAYRVGQFVARLRGLDQWPLVRVLMQAVPLQQRGLPDLTAATVLARAKEAAERETQAVTA